MEKVIVASCALHNFSMTSLQLARLGMLLLQVRDMNIREMRWVQEEIKDPGLHTAWNMAVIEDSLWDCTKGVLDALPEEIDREGAYLFKPEGDDIICEWTSHIQKRVDVIERIYADLSESFTFGELEKEDYDYIDESLRDLLG